MRQILYTLNPPPSPPIPQIIQSNSPSILHEPHLPASLPKLTSCRLSRRDLAISTFSLPLLLPTSLSSQAQAETTDTIAPKTITDNSDEQTIVSYCTKQPVTKKAFLDISIDGKPAGRIIIGLYGKTSPVGSTRFANLVTGAAGISYRRKQFVKIVPDYVQHSGVRSYGVDVELASRTGGNLAADSLMSEWENIRGKCPGTINVAGSVGLIVRDPTKPPPNLKLVAREGKLQFEEEQERKDPNGTEFVISVKDNAELDDSTLVIGRVIDGMDVVEKISNVPTVKENTSSPYFRVAKLVGDKRAVVAERGFNRPYSKVIVSNCGLID